MGCNTSQELKTKKPEDDAAGAVATDNVNVEENNDNDGTTTITEQTTPAVNGDASTLAAESAAANGSSHLQSVEDSSANKSIVPSTTTTTPLTLPSGTVECESNVKNNANKQRSTTTAGAYDVANENHYNGLVNGDIKDDSRSIVRRCEKAEITELNDVGIDEDDEDEEAEEDEAKAATKIQAAFRGHKVRANMKKSTDTPAPNANKNQATMPTDDKSKAAPAEAAGDTDPTKEELEAEFNPNDKELCDAASKIQAAFRGHLSRKIGGNKDADDVDIQEITKKVAEELDIDLTDPELNKAATKIQASFRGHKSRKDLPAAK